MVPTAERTAEAAHGARSAKYGTSVIAWLTSVFPAPGIESPDAWLQYWLNTREADAKSSVAVAPQEYLTLDVIVACTPAELPCFVHAHD